MGFSVLINEEYEGMIYMNELYQKIEEGELDIEDVEKRLIKDRHYTSTNRWVPTKEIKNGYVINSRHTTLISDAHALDMIVF
mgnify:CR=1 FL=1